MKIAMIFPEKLPLNKARSISYLNTCVNLANLTDVTIFIPNDSADKKTIEKFYGLDLSSINIVNLPVKLAGIRSNKLFNLYLKKYIKQFDCFYVRHLKIAKFLVDNKKPNQKVVFEAHEIFFKTLEEEKPDAIPKILKLKKLEAYVYSKVDGITFINNVLLKQFRSTFKYLPNFLETIYLATSFESSYIKKDFLKINEFYYCGNLFSWKGVNNLVLVMKNFPDIKLIIIGGNSSSIEKLSNFAKDHEINNVIFLGYKPPSEIKDILLNKSKITFLPIGHSVYYSYTFPLKLLDYMITSNVVISANIPAVSEIIENGKNGFLYDFKDQNSLIDTINKVLSMSNNDLEQIAKNAYFTAHHFTYKTRAEKIYNFLDKLLKTKKYVKP